MKFPCLSENYPNKCSGVGFFPHYRSLLKGKWVGHHQVKSLWLWTLPFIHRNQSSHSPAWRQVQPCVTSPSRWGKVFMGGSIECVAQSCMQGNNSPLPSKTWIKITQNNFKGIEYAVFFIQYSFQVVGSLSSSYLNAIDLYIVNKMTFYKATKYLVWRKYKYNTWAWDERRRREKMQSSKCVSWRPR